MKQLYTLLLVPNNRGGGAERERERESSLI